MSDADRTVLAAQGLTRRFRDGERVLKVLQGVDLRVQAGETVGIIGRSGTGKSTLLHLLGLLDRPTAGTIRFQGRDVAKLSERQRNRLRGREIGFVFQHYHLLPELNALENVLLPARVAGLSLAQARDRVRHLLDAAGLADRMRHKPGVLSGGEQQRVAIARALVNRPSVVLCDEPTGNLDTRTASGVLDMLFELERAEQGTLVVVTHDEAVAKRAQRCLHLENGRLR